MLIDSFYVNGIFLHVINQQIFQIYFVNQFVLVFSINAMETIKFVIQYIQKKMKVFKIVDFKRLIMHINDEQIFGQFVYQQQICVLVEYNVDKNYIANLNNKSQIVFIFILVTILVNLIMQIKQLILPPNQKKIRFEIDKQGETHAYINTDKQINIIERLDTSKIQLGQLNSIKLTKENQFQNMLKQNPYSSATKFIKSTLGQKKTFCNCKRSKCLKLYCECFSNQLFCNPECSCKSCANTQANSKRLLLLRQQVGLKKNSQQKGCRCQKSNCRKKYCQCFTRNQQCGKYCTCTNCCNKSSQIMKKEEFDFEDEEDLQNNKNNQNDAEFHY